MSRARAAPAATGAISDLASLDMDVEEAAVMLTPPLCVAGAPGFDVEEPAGNLRVNVGERGGGPSSMARHSDDNTPPPHLIPHGAGSVGGTSEALPVLPRGSVSVGGTSDAAPLLRHGPSSVGGTSDAASLRSDAVGSIGQPAPFSALSDAGWPEPGGSSATYSTWGPGVIGAGGRRDDSAVDAWVPDADRRRTLYDEERNAVIATHTQQALLDNNPAYAFLTTVAGFANADISRIVASPFNPDRWSLTVDAHAIADDAPPPTAQDARRLAAVRAYNTLEEADRELKAALRTWWDPHTNRSVRAGLDGRMSWLTGILVAELLYLGDYRHDPSCELSIERYSYPLLGNYR